MENFRPKKAGGFDVHRTDITFKNDKIKKTADCSKI